MSRSEHRETYAVSLAEKEQEKVTMWLHSWRVNPSGNVQIDTLGINVSENTKHKAVLLYDTEQSEVQLFKNVTNLIKGRSKLTSRMNLRLSVLRACHAKSVCTPLFKAWIGIIISIAVFSWW